MTAVQKGGSEEYDKSSWLCEIMHRLKLRAKQKFLYKKPNVFYEKFSEKDNELHEIHLPVRLVGLKGWNAPDENSNMSDYNVCLYIYI